MSILIPVLSFFLILLSAFLILVVLAQKAKSDGGMGAAIGGGMAESAFGAETGNVLTKATINSAIAFFVLAFLLYLGQVYQHKHALSSGATLPTISVPAPAPTTTPPPAPGSGVPSSLQPSSPAVQPAPSPAAPASTTTTNPPPAAPAEQPKKP
jgi:preprotein translocase subunit SecG